MSGTETRRREHQVGVRLTAEEREQLRAAEERTGESPGELLRQAFFGQAGTEASPGLLSAICTDPECTIPRKPGRPMHGPHIIRAGAL